MSIAAYITLAYRVVILAALVFIILFVYRAGQNSDLKADIKALQVQLTANAKTEARWAEEARNAEAQRLVDMQTITAGIASQRTPVIVRLGPRSGSVPGTPATPASGAACSGGSAEGPGKDIRADLNSFELKYEGSLATCRALLEAWPR
jgi:hypothetical protein